jgi:ribosomal protein L10
MVFSINQDPNSAIKSFTDFQANAEADVPPAKTGAATASAAPASATSAASNIPVLVGANNSVGFAQSQQKIANG